MTIQTRTATQTTYPRSNESANGRVYRSVDVQELVSYNIEFSPDGGKSPKQLEALFDQFSDDGVEVDLITAQGLKTDRFNNKSFVVYDVIPKKSIPNLINK